MSINYIDRFNTDWRKILFRPDKKSQAAELNEIQSLINYQYTSAYDYLFSNYKIIKGLKISLESFTSVGYKLKINSGQLFIIIQGKGYFVDVPNTYCEINYNDRVKLGINLDFSYIQDNENLQDPLTGGILCGDLGADRLVITPTLTLNEDSFPIAIVLGRNVGEYPYIFYYKPEGFSLQYESSYVPNLISDYLAIRLYEEAGDFIAEGLHLFLSSSTSFTISPGHCYLNGKRVDLCYPFSYNLPKRSNSIYSIYLTYYGGVIVKENFTSNISNAILIGLVQGDSINYYSIPTNNRSLNNSDLKLLTTQNNENESNFLSFLADKEIVDTGLINKTIFSGFIIDSFSNLNNSDIYSLNYNASIIPKYGILRTGFTATTISFDNLTPTNTTFSQIYNKNGSPYYLTNSSSEKVIINQTRATSFIPLTNITKLATIKVNPINGTANTTTKEFKSLANLEPFNSYLLQANTIGANSITSTFNSTKVTLEGVGYSSLEDNLVLTFGNIKITEFTLIKGTQGSTSQTIKAAEDGSLSLTFLVPSNLPIKDYTIQLSNSNIQAFCSFRSQPNNSNLLSYSGKLAQSFYIDSGLVISKVSLALKQIPVFNGDNLDIALVSIVTTINDLPTNNVLGQGLLNLNQITISSDGSKFSDVTFDLPITLNSKGKYAIVIAPLTDKQPLQFYYAEVGQRSLNSTSVSGDQPLLGGEMVLCINNSWIPQPAKDLTFKLIQASPSTLNSEATFNISNPLGKIHFINSSILKSLPCSTQINYLYKTNTGSWISLNENQPIQGNVNNVDIKIVLSGTSNLFPLVLLNQSYFTIYENLQNSTWISKTVKYEKGYKNVEVEFEYYRPTGTTIKVSFSSNSGETWEQLTEGTSSLIDGNIPLYKATWSIANLDPTTVSTDINGSTSKILRTALTFKVDFSSKTADLVPYVRNLRGIVY